MKFCDVEGFFEWLGKKKTAFIGVGVSNTDCIRLFNAKGADVTVLDRKNRSQLGNLADEFEQKGIKLCLGDGYLDNLEDYDLVVRSPGMYFNHPALTRARRHAVAVTSEMELFFSLCPCRIYAVTGSDGKTTTTTLISEMLAASGKKVHKGGNIGRALLPVIETIKPQDAAVVELSSFQLISMRQSPDVAVVTNVSPNHLDVHKNMREYVESKKNILLHQDCFSRAVLNIDNDITRRMAPLVRGDAVFFSTRTVPERGAFLRGDGMLCVNWGGKEVPVISKDKILLPGMHNIENFLAAVCAVWGEVPVETIKEVGKNFKGVEHRMQLIRERGGVRWYDDSIGTSPTRTIAGLKAFPEKVILIAGGYDKKIPYDPLVTYLKQKVSALILMGATGPVIKKALDNAAEPENNPPVFWAGSMDEAVRIADSLAKSGDAVVLSPASASFDMYPNFEKRGDHFKKLVMGLK